MQKADEAGFRSKVRAGAVAALPERDYPSLTDEIHQRFQVGHRRLVEVDRADR
jgi:hypothetical protein